MAWKIAERWLKTNEKLTEKLKVPQRSVFENRGLFQVADSKWTATGTGAAMTVLELVVDVGDDQYVSFAAIQITGRELRAKKKVRFKGMKWDSSDL